MAGYKQTIGNFLLFVFFMIVMLDPTGSVLHMKDKVFAALMLWNLLFFRPDLKLLPHVLIVFVAVTICYIMAEIQGTITDYNEVGAAYKSLAPLALLPWVKHYKMMQKTLLPAVFVCIISVVCWSLMQSSPLLEKAIWSFSMEHDTMMQISYRRILGIQIFGCYYKSFVSVLFAMFLCIYGFLHATRLLPRIGYLMLCLLFLVACMLSGTRSTMLLPFAMVVMCTWRWVIEKKRLRYLILPLVAAMGVGFLMMIVVLASEGGELSNHVKYLHIDSYINLFSEHPEYLIWGQGPGTLFYTEGFHAFTVRTEWTYLDIVRNYGLLSLVIVTVIAWPLKRLWPYIKNHDFNFGIWCTYLIYLFIAGTNPLLLSSTGMVMILSAYSYAEQVCESNNNELESCK